MEWQIEKCRELSNICFWERLQSPGAKPKLTNKWGAYFQKYVYTFLEQLIFDGTDLTNKPLLEMTAELASSRLPEVPHFDCSICAVSRGITNTVLHSNRIIPIAQDSIFEINVFNYVGKHSINLSVYVVYSFFWANPRSLNFMCRRFGHTLFHLHSWC